MAVSADLSPVLPYLPRNNHGDLKLISLVTASQEPDTLVGGLGRDALIGSAGSDILRGELFGSTVGKQDVFFGGDGGDIFYFGAPPSKKNVDTVVDFDQAYGDSLALSASAFPGLPSDNGFLADYAFHAQRGGKTPDTRIVYWQDNGKAFYDPDGSGPAKKVLFAVFANEPYLMSLDFTIGG